MAYYTITRFYDDGHTDGKILTESEAGGKHKGGEYKETENYDEYCDKHATYEAARTFLNELKEA